ncbi:hypothetical protein SVIO_017500 [Streptomyces violaceusniger]|uniref:Lipoprotein n=1 Tax=Streptomyces violaceusniger TaxID=68280 RepID=A0A4D4KX73_STRVO|nr:hypothetical protein SVIO_017500 [Streptomyces violaceusniger]
MLTAVLLCGGAVGCGSSGADGKHEGKAGEKSSEQVRMAPAAAVRTAAEKSEKLTSFRYRMSGRTPEDGRIEGEAAMSLEPVAVRMKMRAVGQGADAAVEIRMLDGAMYLDGARRHPPGWTARAGSSWTSRPSARRRPARWAAVRSPVRPTRTRPTSRPSSPAPTM